MVELFIGYFRYLFLDWFFFYFYDVFEYLGDFEGGKENICLYRCLWDLGVSFIVKDGFKVVFRGCLDSGILGRWRLIWSVINL